MQKELLFLNPAGENGILKNNNIKIESGGKEISFFCLLINIQLICYFV